MDSTKTYQTSMTRLIGGPTHFRNFRIVGMEFSNMGVSVDAACQFLYKGHYVSVSTAGLNQGAAHTKIIVSKLEPVETNRDQEIVNVTDVAECDTIEEAIECVDMLVGKVLQTV